MFKNSNKIDISLNLFGIFSIIILICNFIYNISHDYPIYDKLRVIAIEDGSKGMNRGKTTIDVNGTWVQFESVNNGKISYEFYQNPFIAKSYIVGNTYKSNETIKGIGTLALFVLLAFINGFCWLCVGIFNLGKIL